MKKVLVLAAVSEVATGAALLIVPSLVGRLLLGDELIGVAISVARVLGIALIGLGVACWPGPPRVGMLIYSAPVTLYLAYIGRGRFERHTIVAGGRPARDPDSTFDAGINKRDGGESRRGTDSARRADCSLIRESAAQVISRNGARRKREDKAIEKSEDKFMRNRLTARGKAALPRLAISAAVILAAPVVALAQQVTGTPGSPSARSTVSNKQLPAPDPKFGGVIKDGALQSKYWWPPRVAPPKDAPNVLLIITDDAGFGVPSTFGGVIPTPTMDRIAKEGLRHNRVFSTALCSPTRAALITGRNHHSAGFGVISEQSTGFPGYNSIIPKDKATIGRILLDNGSSG